MRPSSLERIILGTAGPGEVIGDLREPVALAKMIEEMGMHYISVSAGIAGSQLTQPSGLYPEGVYRLFGWTKAVKSAVTIPVIGSGYSYLRDGKNKLREPEPIKKSFLYWAEKNLKDGNADLAGIGRQSLADPLFPKKVLSGAIRSIHFCTTCDRCLELMLAQKTVGCAIHNHYYRELYRRLKREQKGRTHAPA